MIIHLNFSINLIKKYGAIKWQYNGNKQSKQLFKSFFTNEPEYDENTYLNKDFQEKITINETKNTKEDNNNLSNNNIKSNSEELDTENLIPNPNDNCFKRLQEIQKLLKKESSLKELFIRRNTETLNSIEKECREIYTKKLDVFTSLQKFSRKQKEIRKYYYLMSNHKKTA